MSKRKRQRHLTIVGAAETDQLKAENQKLVEAGLTTQQEADDASRVGRSLEHLLEATREAAVRSRAVGKRAE